MAQSTLLEGVETQNKADIKVRCRIAGSCQSTWSCMCSDRLQDAKTESYSLTDVGSPQKEPYWCSASAVLFLGDVQKTSRRGRAPNPPHPSTPPKPPPPPPKKKRNEEEEEEMNNKTEEEGEYQTNDKCSRRNAPSIRQAAAAATTINTKRVRKSTFQNR